MSLPETLTKSVLVQTKGPTLEYDHLVVCGPDFNDRRNVDSLDFLLEGYKTIGFQATNLGKAVDIINEMIESRNLILEENDNNDDDNELPKGPCKIFLGYTSNLISSGLREVIRYLVQHKMVDVIVATAGAIEEDLIKCLAKTYVGDFREAKGSDLRKRGLNRIGNLLVPNDNYCLFEKWFTPILDECIIEQNKSKINLSPSKLILKLGEKINDENSVLYWCYKNEIPIFSPALTDGSIGDMIYFHSYNNPGLIIDIVQDIRKLNDLALRSKNTGMIILGGGLVKHHICNANLMRNGADYAVFINTGCEYDGSDAGALPDEAISWGKIKIKGKSVKIHSDATLIFPLLVAKTFAKSKIHF